MQARNDASTLPLGDFIALLTDPSSQQIHRLSPHKFTTPYLISSFLRAQPLVEYTCKRVIFSSCS
ncbi:MAG: hypothetical protein K9G11_03940 [Rickettsiaceae bacterium]|nr:hypothetical protein [Rickettsiaceae bacterium]